MPNLLIERCMVNKRENEHAYNLKAYRIINRRVEDLPEPVAVDADSQLYEAPMSLIRMDCCRHRQERLFMYERQTRVGPCRSASHLFEALHKIE
jgi:hypothetical protein